MMQTENNGRKLESGQCLQTNQESGSGMSVIRQQGPSHWPMVKAKILGNRELGKSKQQSPGVKGLAAGQVNNSWTWVRHQSSEWRPRLGIQAVRFFPHATQFSNSPAPTGQPTIQFNSDATQSQHQTPQVKAQSHNNALTSQTSCKCQVPRLLTLLSDVVTKSRAPPPPSPLDLIICQNDSQNLRKCYTHCYSCLGVRFPVRAHTQAADSIPHQDTYGKQPIDVSLSHRCFSLSLFPILSP